jgi:hypothetical protein
MITVNTFPGKKPADTCERKLPDSKPQHLTHSAKDTRSARLGSSFRLPIAYELVEKTEIDAIFEHGGWWTDYYKKYPNSQGFLTLSRVGFSADGKQAMFYAVNECGGKCGTGTYVLMEKAESHWLVVKEILMWIS